MESNDIICAFCIDSIEKIKKAGNKVLVVGGKKVGKSTTLMEYTKNNNKDEFIIYIKFDEMEHKPDLATYEYNYYIELLIAKKMLEFIKERYYDYYVNLALYDRSINNELEKLLIYYYLGSYVEHKYDDIHSYVKNIIEVLKNILGIKKVGIIFDDFDVIGDSSVRFQKEVTNHFVSFDKVIVVTGDKEILKKEEHYKENGYTIVNIDYAKKIENIREILFNYFKNVMNDVLLSYINNDVLCSRLIEDTNGNIDMIIAIFEGTIINNSSLDESIRANVELEQTIGKYRVRKLHL